MTIPKLKLTEDVPTIRFAPPTQPIASPTFHQQSEAAPGVVADELWMDPWVKAEPGLMPPHGLVVLVFDEIENTQRVGAWDEHFGCWDLFGCNPDNCEPTHWRLLPEPPGERP